MQYNYLILRPIAAEGSGSYGTEIIISQTHMMKDVLIEKHMANTRDEGRVPDREVSIEPKDKLHMASKQCLFLHKGPQPLLAFNHLSTSG